MTTQSILDTLDLDKETQQVIKARTSFANAVNRSNLLEILRKIVDGTSCLNFQSSRTRRFISPGRPELLLEFDAAATVKKYPEFHFAFDGSNSHTVNEIRHARDMVAQAEITNHMVDFFTATFKYVLEEKVPEIYAHFTDDIMKVIPVDDLAGLRERIVDIFELRDKDNNSTGELSFIFSITSAIAHSADDELDSDLSCAIELVY